MQQKALDLLALAERDGDLRAAVAALRTALDTIELRARLAERMRAEPEPTVVLEVARAELGAKIDELAARLTALPAHAGREATP